MPRERVEHHRFSNQAVKSIKILAHISRFGAQKNTKLVGDGIEHQAFSSDWSMQASVDLSVPADMRKTILLISICSVESRLLLKSTSWELSELQTVRLLSSIMALPDFLFFAV